MHSSHRFYFSSLRTFRSFSTISLIILEYFYLNLQCSTFTWTYVTFRSLPNQFAWCWLSLSLTDTFCSIPVFLNLESVMTFSSYTDALVRCTLHQPARISAVMKRCPAALQMPFLIEKRKLTFCFLRKHLPH